MPRIIKDFKINSKDLQEVKEAKQTATLEEPAINQELQQSQKPKWVVPVVIGAGAILLGVVIYFVTKKKK
jgi:hypothetical protein